MGIPFRLVFAVLLLALVLSQAFPSALGANETGARFPAHPRTSPPAPSLCITAAFDEPFHLPYADVTISGRVTDQAGDGASGARVAAELWGGPALGATVAYASGDYSLTVQAPGIPGNYSVNVTAEKDGLSARTEPILRVIAEPNGPPEISDVSRTPQNVTSVDDVLVSAGVSDDRGVRNITLAYRAGDGAFSRARMNSTGVGRYTSSIPRQPVNVTVDFYIEAWDGMLTTYYPPAAPAQTASYTVVPGAPGREWVRLVAVLNATECLVDRHFLATGYVRNETGGPVANARLVLTFENTSLPELQGSTDDRGVFQIEGTAPAIPGDYTVRFGCEFGLLSNSTAVALAVRDVLTLTIYASKPSVDVSEKFVVAGGVTRLDGSAAVNASVRVRFEGLRFWWDCRADRSGAYNITVKAPGRSGSYLLNATASFAGMNGSASLRVAVLVPPKGTPAGGAAPVLAALMLAIAAAYPARRRPT